MAAWAVAVIFHKMAYILVFNMLCIYLFLDGFEFQLDFQFQGKLACCALQWAIISDFHIKAYI